MTNKDMFKGLTYDSLDKQVDGDHYKSMKIQPAQFINENNLPFAEGNAIKIHLINSVPYFRYLMMGIGLLLIMRYRPKGIIPEKIVRN